MGAQRVVAERGKAERPRIRVPAETAAIRSMAWFGVGNEPPPDLNLGKNQTWVWGHFVTPVFLTTNGTPGANLCNSGADTTPCVAVLVE